MRDDLIEILWAHKQNELPIGIVADSLVNYITDNFDSKPIYKLPLRTYLLEGLRVLERAGRPLKTAQIAVACRGIEPAIRSHFGQLRHFGLIRPLGDKYELTDAGHNFLNGKALVERWIWQRKGIRKAPPVGEKDGDLAYIHEFEKDSLNDYSDPLNHITA